MVGGGCLARLAPQGAAAGPPRCFGWPMQAGAVPVANPAPGDPADHGTTNWAVWVVGSLPAANDTV